MRWQCTICIDSEARKLKGVDSHSFGKFITIRAKKKKPKKNYNNNNNNKKILVECSQTGILPDQEPSMGLSSLSSEYTLK